MSLERSFTTRALAIADMRRRRRFLGRLIGARHGSRRRRRSARAVLRSSLRQRYGRVSSLLRRLLLKRADRSPLEWVFLLNSAGARPSHQFNCWAIQNRSSQGKRLGSCSCLRVKISLRSVNSAKSSPACKEHSSSLLSVRVVWVRFSRRFR